MAEKKAALRHEAEGARPEITRRRAVTARLAALWEAQQQVRQPRAGMRQAPPFIVTQDHSDRRSVPRHDRCLTLGCLIDHG